MTIGLRIEPEDQTVDPGLPAVFTVHVVNQSGVVDRVALDILGPAATWSRSDPPAVALFPGTDATATLTITAPLGTALGPVPFGVRATAETSGFVEVGEATLNVGASRSVEAELRPRTATGKRRATSVVYLRNLGNAPTKVQVVASDPDDAIVFDAPSAVQIGPGMDAEVPLRMRLPSREKQGATLPYTVLVEGGDSGQALDGQVRQPAKKRWPVMALMLAAVLAVAAIMFLRPVDSVATKVATPDTTTTTAVGAPTTVPPVAATPAPTTPDAAAAAAAAAAEAGGAAPSAGGGGGGAPPAPGGATTVKAPAGVTPGPVGLGGISPTTATTRGLPCPAKGTAQQTAQRVICAWELRRLGEVGDSTTPDTVTKLNSLIPLVGQRAGTTVPDPNGNTLVSFGGCSAGKGVSQVAVANSGINAGRVVSVTPC